MATKEQVYTEQLKELGIYEPAFKPEISTLAQLERELTRAKKAWSATAPPGGKPSVLDPHYAVIGSLRREILVHRETLGLTPKALRRLRGQTAAGSSQQDKMNELLTGIAERIAAYGVSDPDTGEGGSDG